MPKRFVIAPDDRLVVFSTIVDYFTWYDLSYEDALELCAEEMNLHGEQAVKKVSGAFKEPGRWLREVETIRRAHGQRGLEEHLAEIGYSDWLVVHEVMTS